MRSGRQGHTYGRRDGKNGHQQATPLQVGRKGPVQLAGGSRKGNGDGGKTRAEAGIEEALEGKNQIGIIAIGNAPTALLKAIEILAHGDEPFPSGRGCTGRIRQGPRVEGTPQRTAIPLYYESEQKRRHPCGCGHCQRPPQNGGGGKMKLHDVVWRPSD